MLNEEYVDHISNIADQIEQIESNQEEIDSTTTFLGNSHEMTDKIRNRINKLEHDYKALEAIKMVLQNDRKHLSPTKENGNYFYMYDTQGDQIIAAIAVQVKGDQAEVKWLGSIKPGHGKPLLYKALEKAKQMGARKVQLTSKWESEGFYTKAGLKKAGNANSLFGNMGNFIGNL